MCHCDTLKTPKLLQYSLEIPLNFNRSLNLRFSFIFEKLIKKRYYSKVYKQ